MKHMKKTALVILTSLFLVTSGTAFTQGHPLSQIFGDSGTFADCGDQFLAGNGSCISLSSGTSESGIESLSAEFSRDTTGTDDVITLTLNDGEATAQFDDKTGSGSGTTEDNYLPEDEPSTSVDMADQDIENARDIYLGGENRGLRFEDDSGADGTYPTIGFKNGKVQTDSDIKVYAGATVTNLPSPDSSSDAASKEYVDNQVESSGGGKYLPDDEATSSVNMDQNNLIDVNSIRHGSDDGDYYSGGPGILFSDTMTEMYDSSGVVRFIVDDDGAMLGGELDMTSGSIKNVENIKYGDDSSTFGGGPGMVMTDGTIQFYDDGGMVRASISDSGMGMGGDITMNGHDINNVGNCGSCDVAETVEKADGAKLEKGDVVTINENGNLEKASSRYDSDVAGVVSSSPVIMMGGEDGGVDFGENVAEGKSAVIETEDGKKEVPLALAGLVPVKASAANGEIEPGDKLTTSKSSGYAVKAEPIMTSDGREVYGSGIIGKARESLGSGQGEIEMLVSVE